MRILMLTHAFNSLSQRLFVELRRLGHELSVEFDINDAVALEAVSLFQPELILAPFLKRAIPEAIWRRHVCLVLHPGIIGDRGPSALDWAILNGEERWGVTVLQANGEMDAGDIWASAEFPMRPAAKSSLYRHEVSEAAVKATKLAVSRFERGDYRPEPLAEMDGDIRGQWRPYMRQQQRAIDWSADDTETVLRKIRSADGYPGLKDKMFNREVFLFDTHAEPRLRGKPGELIGRCRQALCRATLDGAVWIGQLRDAAGEQPFKLPAAQVLAENIGQLPEIAEEESGYREIRYEEANGVGYLHFPFYNGAMGSEQCRRLLAAYRQATARPTRLIVLMGGPDFWSNGMHLNLIEAADSPADESWRNINAMDDLAEAIITTGSHLTIAAIRGNAGAGGVFLARAADEVWAHGGIVLNPHYRDMGNLYGSEYWSYLLPRLVGAERAEAIMRARLPMGAAEALEMGLLDTLLADDVAGFLSRLRQQAESLAASADLADRLAEKRRRRCRDETEKPLAAYRQQELERMRLNFYGFDPSYHVARYNFVFKVPRSRTPLTIASHRRLSAAKKRAA